jgi:sulfur carrier protein ThiS
MGVRIRVELKPDGRRVELEFESEPTVADLLKRLGLSSEAAIAIVGGRVAPEWERIRGDQEVIVIRAVSGG